MRFYTFDNPNQVVNTYFSETLLHETYIYSKCIDYISEVVNITENEGKVIKNGVKIINTEKFDVNNWHKYVNFDAAEIANELISKNGLFLRHIKNPSYSQMVIALKKDGLALECIPAEKQTLELCLIAVSQNGLALMYVSEVEFNKNSELFNNIAVKKNGASLKYVKTKCISEYVGLAKIAVENNSLARIYLATYLKSQVETAKVITEEESKNYLDECDKIIKKNKFGTNYVPPPKVLKFFIDYTEENKKKLKRTDDLTDEEILKIISVQGMQIVYLSKHKMSLEICEAAYKNNPKSLYFMPEKMQKKLIINNQL